MSELSSRTRPPASSDPAGTLGYGLMETARQDAAPGPAVEASQGAARNGAPASLDANFAYQQQRLSINGMQMNVATAGEGEPVLLVHGYPDTHRVWRKQFAALVAAGYRVIAPDMRGCGQTDLSPRTGDYGVNNLVTDLRVLLDALRVEKVRLVGHDWGAAIGWHFVVNHPERIDRYVTLSTGHPAAYRRGGLEQKKMGYYALLFQLPKVPEALLRGKNWWGLRQLTRYPEELGQWESQLGRPGRLTAGINYYRANARMLFSDHLAKARVPVLGVWSSGDRFLSEKQMKDSAHFVDGPFRYERLEGANHWLQLSAAERLNPLLLEYLA